MSIWNDMLTGNYESSPFYKWERMLEKLSCSTLYDKYHKILLTNALNFAKGTRNAYLTLNADDIMYSALTELTVRQRAFEQTINDFSITPFVDKTHAYWLIEDGIEEFSTAPDKVQEKGCTLLNQMARVAKMLCTLKKFYYLMYSEDFHINRERFWDADKWRVEVGQCKRSIRIRTGNPHITDSDGPNNNADQILTEILIKSLRSYCQRSWSGGNTGFFYNSYGKILQSVCSEKYYDGIFKL